MNYRAEVDGLRAIAVLAVILYHAEIVVFGRDWFEGGFIGVDIFFVISGYLITKIILSELFEKGSFSFRYFYERRARRILPMLFTVMLVSFPFAWQLLLPTEFVEYSQSILSAVFFGSNYFFYFATTDYGAESALLKPFLHTWSLGIEEQFYIVFPVFVTLSYKIVRNHLLILFVATLVLSLQVAEFLSVRNPELNFYLPISRFWELLVGSVLTYVELKRGRNRNALAVQILPIAGLLLIAYSILFFNAQTLHPGYVTVLPIVGVALVIAFSSTKDVAGKVLGSKPFVAVGLISYSAYLWHFPIFAFSRISDSVITDGDKFGWIVLTFLLSVLSYFFVERPFRNKSIVSIRALSLCASSAFLLVTIPLFVSVKSEGFPNRFSRVSGFLNYERDNEKLRQLSWTLLDEKLKSGFDDDSTKVLIVGNSHGKDTFNAFFLNNQRFQGFDFLRGDVEQISCFDDKNSDNHKAAEAFYESETYQSSDIVLVSTGFTMGQCHRGNEKVKKSTDLEGLPYLVERALSDRKGVMLFGNTTVFPRIGDKPLADYLILKEEEGGGLEQIAADEDRFREFAYQINAAFDEMKDRKEPINKEVRRIAEEYSVMYFDKFDVVCEDRSAICFGLTPDGFKSFYDPGHHTLEGAKFFGERMADLGMLDLLHEAVPTDSGQRQTL